VLLLLVFTILQEDPAHLVDCFLPNYPEWRPDESLAAWGMLVEISELLLLMVTILQKEDQALLVDCFLPDYPEWRPDESLAAWGMLVEISKLLLLVVTILQEDSAHLVDCFFQTTQSGGLMKV